ncbi:MAG: DUF4185 domain-containing protein [Deltaproteobacteria bacterium]|nr:DUF4185 domain-containing protein [Deltaproteobacteria bacterium]
MRRRIARTCSALLAASVAGGCYLSHGFDRDDDAGETATCSGVADFHCVKRESGACSALVEVPPECDLGELVWRCPTASRVYRTATPEADCLPFHSPGGPLARLGSGGITLETGDGRCLWILGDGVAPDGTVISHPAAVVPDDLPLGACPPGGSFLGGEHPVSVVDLADLGEGSLFSPGDSVRQGGRSWIFGRHWVLDAASTFGVRKVGTKLGWFDDGADHVRFLEDYLWMADADFGDSALVVDDVPYVYGCYGEPHDLGYDCHLARADRGPVEQVSSYRYFAGAGGWSADAAESVVVFQGGPHRSSVRYLPGRGRYVHVSIEGFGDHIDVSLSDRPDGPWSAPAALIGCRLPSDDPDALCGYPMLHPELSDPLAPSDIVVSYDVSTLAPDAEERRQANPDAYWPRLVRVTLP